LGKKASTHEDGKEVVVNNTISHSREGERGEKKKSIIGCTGRWKELVIEGGMI